MRRPRCIDPLNGHTGPDDGFMRMIVRRPMFHPNGFIHQIGSSRKGAHQHHTKKDSNLDCFQSVISFSPQFTRGIAVSLLARQGISNACRGFNAHALSLHLSDHSCSDHADIIFTDYNARTRGNLVPPSLTEAVKMECALSAMGRPKTNMSRQSPSNDCVILSPWRRIWAQVEKLPGLAISAKDHSGRQLLGNVATCSP